MTREEAIRMLSNRDAHGVPCGYTSGYQEAFDMAIKALEELPKRREEAKRWKRKALQVEPIKHGYWEEEFNGNGWNDFWDYTCSVCGKKWERADDVLYESNFCPNCGAKMDRENNDE